MCLRERGRERERNEHREIDKGRKREKQTDEHREREKKRGRERNFYYLLFYNLNRFS